MNRSKLIAAVAVFGYSFAANAFAADGRPALRPPAVPLVTSDPYLSVWSEADRLTDDVTRHWTHHEHSLVSMIHIDGKSYRLMGRARYEVPALPQVGLKVLPTRSIYDFENSQIHVTLTFMTPALPHDLDVLTRPLTYLTWRVRSVDGAAHDVSIFDSVSSQLAVNSPDQKVDWARETMGDLTALRVGTVDQAVLARAGDDTRIDWGYVYLVANAAQSAAAIEGDDVVMSDFSEDGTISGRVDTRMPRAVSDHQPVLAIVFDLGKVKAEPVERHAMVAYDEIYSIKFFGTKLRPFWRRDGATPPDLFQVAEHDYPQLVKRCEAFDRELMADLEKVGGRRYAQIAALAYRQCLAATGIAADANKQPLLFTKENTSNGDIATVDVIFPMDPMMLVFSPTLAKASLVPILNYAASSHWKFPNAPHDLGTYPIARGTDDGGEGMPVEESGNMLLLCDAIAQEEGKPDFVAPWWPQLTQWARYLEKFGSDPEEQLCTDDFMGHLAHNSNLSVKAILALAAYGDLCRMRGDAAEAERYTSMAKKFAEHWVRVSSDGDHSRLAFDKPNTWSQKYNLVWDKILGLNIFPPEAAQHEVAYYKSMLQPYGVPLDSRTKLTKTDWSLWSATLADNQADFEAIVSPIYDYLNATSARSPLVDSYVTNDIHSDGMHARPVVGGIFVKLLADPAMRKKWSGGDPTKVGDWAPLPVPPKVKEIVPSGQHQAVAWRYSLTKLAADFWNGPRFDDSGWKEGPAGFGTKGTPGIVVRTIWNTDDIWLRREFTMPEGPFHDLHFSVFHDEDVEIYVNGILASAEGGFITSYEPLEIRRTALAELKPGAKITLAVHCHQTTGGQGVDVGLVDVVER
jgi:hypothetical protein